MRDKYRSATERNVLNVERIQKEKGTTKYAGKTLAQAKHALGIRQEDSSYDVRIANITCARKK